MPGGSTGTIAKPSFIMVAAPADGYKTKFLMDCAVENARHGRKLAFVDFESDDERVYEAPTSRIEGRNITDAILAEHSPTVVSF